MADCLEVYSLSIALTGHCLHVVTGILGLKFTGALQYFQSSALPWHDAIYQRDCALTFKVFAAHETEQKAHRQTEGVWCQPLLLLLCRHSTAPQLSAFQTAKQPC